MFPTTHPSSILCCSENSTSLENIDMEESPRHHLGHGDDLAAPVVSFSGSPLDSAGFASVSPQDCRDALKAMQAKQGPDGWHVSHLIPFAVAVNVRTKTPGTCICTAVSTSEEKVTAG